MQVYNIFPFSDYVLRTPLFPLSCYFDLIENYSSEKAKELYKKPIVKEAIALASPELRRELDKWSAEKFPVNDQKKQNLELTFLKYIARMSSRCTPFGLFAGCSVGTLDLKTNILLQSIDKHTRFTQLDMQYWVAILQDIAMSEKVILQLKYYPNNSIYEMGDFYRFIEYKTVAAKREHSISSFRKSTLLEKILKNSKSGLTVNKIIALLAENETEKEQAKSFVLKLIDSQFLVSELETSLTEENEWKRIINVLHKIPFLNTKKELLIQLNRKLLELDSKLCASEEFHKEIKKTTDKIGTLCDEKYLLQADLNILTLNNSLNNKISDKVLEAIQFLNNIQVQKEFINLENFKKAFVNRYETKELPLSMVLDPETGIGYLQNQDMNDTHDILDSFSFKMKEAAQKLQDWSEIDFVLQKKLLECYLHKKNEIIVTERDFNSLYTSLKNTPVTFSVIIETFKNDQIALVTAGNVSAAKILGRFCNGNPEIYNLTKQIIQKENEYHDDKILAEIVHIPESRTGNILKRPPLRKHEISYLCKSGVLKESNLELEDLYVSVKSNRIVLRSKKYNREILPCMSNAHNFTNNSLPIYHFLCELEIQDTKPIFSFNWGVLDLHYNYFPRVIYKGIILCKAKWKIKKEEIASFYKLDQNVMKDLFFKWRSQRNIPRFVNWLNYDNTLLFDLESSIAIELFLKSIKQKEEFFLEEFLFTEKSIVKNNTGDDFSNQIILSYYKEKI